MKPTLMLLFYSDYSIARFGKRRKEFPPLGIMYLAAACENAGFSVIIKDLSQLNDFEIPEANIIGLSIIAIIKGKQLC